MAKSDKQYRYTYGRRGIYYETWTIEADSPEEALELLDGGNGEMCDYKELEFVDYHDDDYELEDSEIIDPLYKMIADKNAEILERKKRELENG